MSPILLAISPQLLVIISRPLIALKGQSAAQRPSPATRREDASTTLNAGDSVKARVRPELLSPNSMMYNIDGTTSIVEFETDVLGLLSVVETDPDPQTTAYGLLADFLNAVQG